MSERIIETFPVLIKVVVFAGMTVVGTDCTLTGLRDILRRPSLWVAVTLGQFFLVPVVMYACCYQLGVSIEVTASLILIACCPTGSISNTYCYFARGNSSLSVSLTALSTLVALVATPTTLSVARGILGSEDSGLPLIPILPLLQELGLMMIVPFVIGVTLRARKPEWILDHQRTLRRVALILLIALLGLIFGSRPSEIAQYLQEISLVTALFTISLLSLGWLVGRAFRLSSTDWPAVLFEFPCRNLSIAAVIGITVLNRPELVRFAAALFLIQAVMLLPLTWAIVKQRADVRRETK